MSTVFVYGHFGTLEFVQFLPNGCFILWSQSCPWLIGSPIVVVSLRNLYVIVESDDL